MERRRRLTVAVAGSAAALAIIASACSGAMPQTTQQDGSSLESTAPGTATNRPAPFGDFALPLQTGTYLEFAWDQTATATGAGTSKSAGRFRVVLAQPSQIAGETLYAIRLERSAGDDPSFAATEWRYLGVDGNRILGSTDGSSLRVVLDAERGKQPGGGFFGEPAAQDQLLELSVGKIDNPYVSGEALVLTESAQVGGCETFPDVGTVCRTRSENLVRRNYFRAGIGPIGYFSFASATTRGGGASNQINIGLVGHSFTGAASQGGAQAANVGYVRVSDDTGTVSIEVPAPWRDVNTQPVTIGQQKIPTIAAAPDLRRHSSMTGPGLVFAVLPLRANASLLGFLEEATQVLPTSCTALESPREIVANRLAAASFVRCSSAGAAILLYVVRPDRPVESVFLLRVQLTPESVDAFKDVYETVLDSVVVLR